MKTRPVPCGTQPFVVSIFRQAVGQAALQRVPLQEKAPPPILTAQEERSVPRGYPPSPASVPWAPTSSDSFRLYVSSAFSSFLSPLSPMDTLDFIVPVGTFIISAISS